VKNLALNIPKIIFRLEYYIVDTCKVERLVCVHEALSSIPIPNSRICRKTSGRVCFINSSRRILRIWRFAPVTTKKPRLRLLLCSFAFC
ncbi:MAG: hypothetical protein IIU11_07140, partial [Bacteroidales bacterium]|nr:hypothetical protein [Bacteroidales bacterium]